MAQQVADILGCDLDYANGLLEAAGGDPNLAIELGFGGGVPSDVAPSAAAAWTPPYAHYQAIWPEAAPLVDSWKDQRLDVFATDVGSGDGIVQALNGPCGVLAVVQAELWVLASTFPAMSLEDRLTTAVSNILERVVAAKDQSNTVVTLADGSTCAVKDAARQIRTASALVEAIAITAGIGTTVQRMTPLVEGPHWLCSSDLLCLLLRGSIGTGNVGAFSAMYKQKTSFYGNDSSGSNNKKIGVLSMTEIDEKIPVADDLKFTDTSVWVIHTGDHFMTMRQKSNDNNTIVMEVYDGLQPNGPISKYYSITGDVSLAPKAPNEHVETFVKKRPGQPDDLVQAQKTDSTNYKDWKFEVVPAVDDPSVHGPLDVDPNEPPYDFATLPLPTDKWRCGSCYSNRFKTMNFGTNSAGSERCEVCQMDAREAMWSLWLPFGELTPRMQRRARQMYASKQELIVSTLYPKAEIAETAK